MNFKPPETKTTTSSSTAEKALSLVSKGWEEVRSSEDTDLQLIRNRAKELENFINSASKPPFVVPKITSTATKHAAPAEIDYFVKKLRKLQLNLSGIKNGIVKGKEDEGKFGELNWEPIKAFRNRFKEMEVELKSLSSSSSSPVEEVFEGIKKSEFVEKVKSSLKSICKEPEETKGVPLLDVPELLAYLVRQSSPFLDQIGMRRDISDKIVESLCSKRRNKLSLRTAVHPLFRAAYLAKSEKQNVTLLAPWLCKSDQELVYPNNLTFSSPEEQELYIRNWLEERVGFKTDFKISFYPGKFSKERRSIIPAGDTSQFMPSRDADIAILEEPEHLTWYHHGKRWTDKFNHVVGIVHTNYLEYIKREKNGALQSFLVKHINNWVTRAHCDKVLRLSAATQDLPRSVVCNVHGVNPKFLKIGEKVAAERQSGQQGYRELIDLLAKHKTNLDGFNVDVFGNGEDAHEVYKVFINPSISDVLCTATAEALAMGKFVVCADHPSNEFFRAFPNCLTYKTSEDFVAKEQYKLSWEAATQRFMEYSDLDKFPCPNLGAMVDGSLAFVQYCLTGNEFLRLCTGAIPGTRDYDKQHSEDLHLLPPLVENPIYGW
ncbi:unnamed protein product [Withania somnifera]